MPNIYYNKDREYENNINELRVAQNLSLNALAEICNVSTGMLLPLVQGTMSPTYLGGKRKGEVKPWVKKILDHFHRDLYEVFPFEACVWKPKLDLLPDHVVEICHGNYVSNKRNIYETEFVQTLIDQTLSTLTEREQCILQMLFYEEKSFVEVGNEFGMSHQRIRQIEAKALRKLRHPSRCAPLRCLVGNDKYDSDPIWFAMTDEDATRFKNEKINEYYDEYQRRELEREIEAIKRDKIRLENERLKAIEHAAVLEKIRLQEIEDEKERKKLQEAHRLQVIKEKELFNQMMKKETKKFLKTFRSRDILGIDRTILTDIQKKVHNHLLFEKVRNGVIRPVWTSNSEWNNALSAFKYNYSPKRHIQFFAMYIKKGASFTYTELTENIQAFSSKYNLSFVSIDACLKGELIDHNDWIFTWK